VLSPADLSVEDSHGRFAGNKDKKIVAEISDSHPCYLIKNALLLPRDTALTRHITGKDQGKYKWCSIYPDGVNSRSKFTTHSRVDVYHP
jgi:hypothetical protein